MKRAVAAAAFGLFLVTGCGGAHAVTLRYNPDGVQETCTVAELGTVATVTGDGAPFTARCDQDGPVYVWDAQG